MTYLEVKEEKIGVEMQMELLWCIHFSQSYPLLQTASLILPMGDRNDEPLEDGFIHCDSTHCPHLLKLR